MPRSVSTMKMGFFVTDRLGHAKVYPPNSKCLTSPVTEVLKAMQIVENGVV